MPPVGFEPIISVGERPQTYALDSAATGTGFCGHMVVHFLGGGGFFLHHVVINHSDVSKKHTGP